MTKLIAANWKMNGLIADSDVRVKDLLAGAKALSGQNFFMVLCPPATLLMRVGGQLSGTSLMLGGQDCHAQVSGAFTGDLSAVMLKDAGCSHVIIGHSERRHGHGETSDTVKAKAKAAHAAGLVAIICVGETDAERMAGQESDVVATQLAQSVPEGAHADNTVIAYEPVWAIGTGKTPSSADIIAMHAMIRIQTACKILYGGSVKAANAKEILHLPNVDGALVGGASLKADEFLAIAAAAA